MFLLNDKIVYEINLDLIVTAGGWFQVAIHIACTELFKNAVKSNIDNKKIHICCATATVAVTVCVYLNVCVVI